MSRLMEGWHRSRWTLTVELDPPRGANPLPLLEKARQLAGRADAFNLTDGAMARVRMNSIAAATLLERHSGVETIFHLTCRDRNLLGLQADLLGATGLGLRNVLVLGGDDVARGDEPRAKAVFDVDAASLVELIGRLNRGSTWSGRELEAPTQLTVGVAANPGAKDVSRELDRLAQKVAAGAGFAQTQPVFDPRLIEGFQAALERSGLKIPILYGVLPLRDLKQARYFDEKVPGIDVPTETLRRLEQGDEQTGVGLATELIRRVAPAVAGVHLFPMGSVARALGVIEGLEEYGIRPSNGDAAAGCGLRQEA